MACPDSHDAVYNNWVPSFPLNTKENRDIATKVQNSAFWGSDIPPQLPHYQPGPPLVNQNRDSRFITETGYQKLYEKAESGGKLYPTGIPVSFLGCGGSDVLQPDPTELTRWYNSLKDWPCLKEIPIDAYYRVGSPFPDGHLAGSPFTFENPGYESCVSNWQAALNSTTRFPCQQFLTHVDVLDGSKYTKDAPVPDDVYQKCLINQDKYFKTPDPNNNCPVEVTGKSINTGFDGTENTQATSTQFCICNCSKYGIDVKDCENICTAKYPDTSNFKDATDVKTSGWYFDPSSKKCAQSTANNGEFPLKEICANIYAKSGGKSGGGGGGNTPTEPTLPTVIAISVAIITFIILFIIYRYL